MSYTRISLVHPTGNPNSREAAFALGQAGLLQEIVTTIAYNPNKSISRYFDILPQAIKHTIAKELGRRTWVTPNSVTMRTHPLKEILRVALVKTNLNRPLGFGSTGPIDWVYTSLDRHFAKHHLQGLDAVYAYEDGAAHTFEIAKKKGILCLYDLPIMFYPMAREIQQHEAELFPELSESLKAVREPQWKLKRKKREITLADGIFVPSSVVKKSLLDAGVKSEKITVIPFGAPIDYFSPQSKKDKVFRALFVGRVGARKGVHYLLQAWKELGLTESELLLIGLNEFPQGWLKEHKDSFRYIPSVPHHCLNQYYTSASVFVLPSLVEGLALVQLEAMACGIPIITTENTGGSDIITDGVEGFIVPIRDIEAIKEKLEWCYHHPQELAEMGRAARQKAEQLTWSLYHQRLANKVQEILSNK